MLVSVFVIGSCDLHNLATFRLQIKYSAHLILVSVSVVGSYDWVMILTSDDLADRVVSLYLFVVVSYDLGNVIHTLADLTSNLALADQVENYGGSGSCGGGGALAHGSSILLVRGQGVAHRRRSASLCRPAHEAGGRVRTQHASGARGEAGCREAVEAGGSGARLHRQIPLRGHGGRVGEEAVPRGWICGGLEARGGQTPGSGSRESRRSHRVRYRARLAQGDRRGRGGAGNGSGGHEVRSNGRRSSEQRRADLLHRRVVEVQPREFHYGYTGSAAEWAHHGVQPKGEVHHRAAPGRLLPQRHRPLQGREILRVRGDHHGQAGEVPHRGGSERGPQRCAAWVPGQRALQPGEDDSVRGYPRAARRGGRLAVEDALSEEGAGALPHAGGCHGWLLQDGPRPGPGRGGAPREDVPGSQGQGRGVRHHRTRGRWVPLPRQPQRRLRWAHSCVSDLDSSLGEEENVMLSVQIDVQRCVICLVY